MTNDASVWFVEAVEICIAEILVRSGERDWANGQAEVLARLLGEQDAKAVLAEFPCVDGLSVAWLNESFLLPVIAVHVDWMCRLLGLDGRFVVAPDEEATFGMRFVSAHRNGVDATLFRQLVALATSEVVTKSGRWQVVVERWRRETGIDS